MNYTCVPCDFKSDNKTNYKIHLSTSKHKLNKSNTLKCNYCKYNTIKKSDYERHLTSKKHLKNSSIEKNKISVQDLIDKVKDGVKEEVKETIEVLVNKITDTNNINTNKIVKEARVMKKSVLSLLNTHFKDTPSIDYIEQKPFFKALEEEYNAKINDGTDKLFMRIFTDYNKKKLIKTLSDLILKFVKKDNQKFQSVFNIDSARSNFATKIDDFWLNDKKGLQLRKFTVDKVVHFMIDVLEVFRLQLVEIRKENIKNPTSERNDYLMENQTLLLEVVSFLTNSNTYTKIITQLSPNLRCDEQLLLLN